MVFSEPLRLTEHMSLFKDDTLMVTIGFFRPFNRDTGISDRSIGVTAVLKDSNYAICIWAVGSAKSDDIARAWILNPILEHLHKDKHLVADSRGLNDILLHVRNRRRSGDLSKSENNNKPIKGHEVLVPLEQALEDGRWTFRNVSKKSPPEDFKFANDMAEAAYGQNTSLCSGKFNTHGLDWYITESGIRRCPKVILNGVQ